MPSSFRSEEISNVFSPSKCTPPIPPVAKNLIDKWIKSSINKANEKLINGKELTPFLITEMNTLSKNETLNANKELIINNALIAGKIAAKYLY